MSIAHSEPAQTLSEAPSRDVAQMLARLGANRDRGLTTTEVRARLLRDGPNEVPEKKSPRLIGVARKFWGLSAWMIELIALISWLLGRYVDLWIVLVLAAALFTDACVGASIGLYGLAELRPVPFTWTLLIVAYAFFCSLLVNDPLKPCSSGG